MHSPKAILWDMDGVLADTSSLHFQTWETVLHDQGIPIDRQKFHHIFGLKNQDLLPYLTGKPLEQSYIADLAAQKELAFRSQLVGKLKLFPGVVSWLRRFKSMGWKQAVASSAPPENVEAVVDELRIREYFDALVTPGELPGKPDPAVFLAASHRLGIPVEACIVIEDSLPGVEAARRARIHCIAVANTNPPEVLSQADIVVHSLDQLTLQQVESLFPV